VVCGTVPPAPFVLSPQTKKRRPTWAAFALGCRLFIENANLRQLLSDQVADGPAVSLGDLFDSGVQLGLKVHRDDFCAALGTICCIHRGQPLSAQLASNRYVR
jgi:hypothetical protein